MTWLLRKKADLLAGALIVLPVVVMGWYVGAWTGFLKGDDAYLHVGIINFITENFPQVTWYPYNSLGYPPFEVFHPFRYLIFAILHWVMGISPELLLKIALFLSLTGLGLAIYLLSRLISLPRPLGVGFALLVFSSPILWNVPLIGGAYPRSFALLFSILSLSVAYWHITKINEDRETWKGYLLTVATLAVTAYLHILIWTFTFLMLVCLYAIGVRQWRRKLAALLRVFIPVGGLASSMYLPALIAFFKLIVAPETPLTVHDTVVMQWEWLTAIPSSKRWSINPGPLIVPVGILCISFSLVFLDKVRGVLSRNQVLLALLVTEGIFSAYFFVFGWLPIPQALYLMAAYDHVFWLSLSLPLFSLAALSAVNQAGVFAPLKANWKRVTTGGMAIALLLSMLPTMSFIRAWSSTYTPDEPSSLSAATKEIVDIALQSSDPGYRLGVWSRLITRWINYEYPDVAITGGRDSTAALNKYYYHWAMERILYRSDRDKIDEIYLDDRPLVLRQEAGGQDNLFSSLFWLDWLGARGAILTPTIYPQGKTTVAYASRPQFFDQYAARTKFGEMYYFTAEESSPILVSPRALVVAVPFSPGNAPAFYTNIIDVLSTLNLNSQWIIPIKLERAEGLADFATAIVDNATYVQYQQVLEQFVSQGGHLIVMGAGDSQPRLTNITPPSLEISFPAKARQLEAPSDSLILVEVNSGPLVYRQALGQGSLTISGIAAEDLLESNSPVAPILLAVLMEPELPPQVTTAELDSSHVSYTTGVTAAEVLSSGSGKPPTLQFTVDASSQHSQVNWKLPLPRELSASSNALLTFSLRQDTLPASNIAIVLEKQGKEAFLDYTFTRQSWNGWRSFTIPLSAFQQQPVSAQINSYDSITVVFNVDPPYTKDASTRDFAVHDVQVIELESPPGFVPLDGEWLQPNKFKVILDGERRVLWKESYTTAWKAKTDRGEEISFYFAGPGLIYLVAPQGAREITMYMPLPKVLLLGLGVSAMFLLCFVYYALAQIVRLPLPGRSHLPGAHRQQSGVR